MNYPNAAANPPTSELPGYRLYVNDDRTVLVRIWPGGTAEVATRDQAFQTWGPPIYLSEEKA